MRDNLPEDVLGSVLGGANSIKQFIPKAALTALASFSAKSGLAFRDSTTITASSS